MLTIQNYVRAQSIEEAYQLNQNKGNCLLGGMMWLRMSRRTVGTAIDLSGLGLDEITEDETYFSIGAMTTLRQLEQHPGFSRYTEGAASEALGQIVGVQFRNLATVGGSVWGRFGFSSVLTVLLALDAEVELYKGGIVPLQDFMTRKKDRDILLGLRVRKTPGHFAYQSMRIQRTDFSVLECMTAWMDGEIRTAVGARPMKAMLLRSAAEDELLCSDEKQKRYARWVAEQTPTGSNLRGSAAYRARLAEGLTLRNLRRLGGTQA